MTEKKNKIPSFIRNKFVLTSLIFLIWILLFDSNNILDRMKDLRNLKQLERDRVYYLEQIKTDSARLQELRTNDKNLEKFAREQYLMKKDNEDIFIVIDKSKEKK